CGQPGTMKWQNHFIIPGYRDTVFQTDVKGERVSDTVFCGKQKRRMWLHIFSAFLIFARHYAP
ncbi:MAG: hypothetical protein J5875_01650, partial [Paludibacteraceae bacterium]|nr:hypothetical protein [Paludibacteraceae bacterium]